MDNGGRFIRVTRIFNAHNIERLFREFVYEQLQTIRGAQVKHFECDARSTNDHTSARIQLVRQDQQPALVERLMGAQFINGYVDAEIITPDTARPGKFFKGQLKSATISDDIRRFVGHLAETTEIAIKHDGPHWYAFVHVASQQQALDCIDALHLGMLNGQRVNVEASHGQFTHSRQRRAKLNATKTTRSG